MKRLINIFIVILCLSTINIKAEELNIQSKNAILYNASDDEIMYEKNKTEIVQIASLTKIMTALVTLENIDNLDKQIIITKEDLNGLSEANLVTAGFTVGEVVTYKDLLYALLLPSGADAANALRRNVSNNFIELMNEKTKKLKLKNTKFNNPIGLDDENNYSSVEDLLIIFKEALKNEEFKKIITTKECTTTDGKLTFKSTIQRNAKKYGIEVPYIEGGKTGTTGGAGLCLASIAKDENKNLILITTGATYDKIAPHHIEDAKTIYDYFIKNYNNQKIVDKKKSFKKLKTKYTNVDYIKLYPKKDLIKYLPDNYNKEDITYKYKGKQIIKYNDKGEIGTLKIYYKNKLIDTQKITLKKKLKFSIKKYLKENIIMIISIIITSIIIIFVLIKRAK
ncbi:MAG: D-alanyl-D-alanine carboxypeptidase [Bacilli bacterium]|nr:D-alanyl-D-alanine carboxypeptidase [Bacilli bacterium]